MRKQIELLEYHSDLLTMTVDIHLGICDVGSLKEDFSPGRLLKEIQERRNVDLPQPDGPIMATTSPLRICVVIPLRT